MKVAIFSDDETFLPSLAAGYINLGCEVVVGRGNLRIQSFPADLIHLHWPEELTGWRPPTQCDITGLVAALSNWKKKSTIVSTVHNLLPHRAQHPVDHDLYSLVYGKSDVIGHFSEYSREKVKDLFPELHGKVHVVHRPHLLTHLRTEVPARAKARRGLGLADDEFAVLIFGALRNLSEFTLLTSAIRRARVRNLRVIFGGRLPSAGLMSKINSRLRYEIWRQKRRLLDRRGFVHESDVQGLFEAADAVVVPRAAPHLNSGLLPLAMTFGTPVVAPMYGIYSEYLSGSENELYTPGEPSSLAKALERMALKETAHVVRSNERLSRDWGWEGIVVRYMEALRGKRVAT